MNLKVVEIDSKEKKKEKKNRKTKEQQKNCTSNLPVFDCKKKINSGWILPHTAHPATLDSQTQRPSSTVYTCALNYIYIHTHFSLTLSLTGMYT